MSVGNGKTDFTLADSAPVLAVRRDTALLDWARGRRRLLVMVGVDDFFDQLVRLGMPMRESGSYFGYSLALGSPDIPLVQLTNAYRALANGGRYSPVAYARGGKPQFRQAMDAGAAYVVGDMLAAAGRQ